MVPWRLCGFSLHLEESGHSVPCSPYSTEICDMALPLLQPVLTNSLFKKTLFKCMFLLFVAMSFPGEEVGSSCHSDHLLTVWDVQGDLSMWSDSCLKSVLLPLDGIQKTPVIFHFEIPFAACYMLTRELRDPWGNEWHQHEQFVIMTRKITG